MENNGPGAAGAVRVSPLAVPSDGPRAVLEGLVLRRLRVWFGIGISLLFVGLLLWKSHPRDVLDAISHADFIWLVPAILIFFAELWVRAVRYQHIMRGLKRVSAGSLFPMLVIGNMANNLLPLRMGEIVRAYLIGQRYQISRMSSLGTGVTERLFDGLTCLAFLAITVLWLGANSTIYDITFIAIAIFALVLALFIACIASPDGSERAVQRMSRLLPARFRDRVVGMVISFIEGLRSLRHPDAIVWVVGTSVLAWLMETAVFWCVGQAFALDISVGYYMMAVAAANLALIVPSSPGGTGVFEFAITQALLLGGIDDATATAYAFTAHFTVLMPATLLGLYCLWSMHLSLGRLSHTAETAMETVPIDEVAPPTPVTGGSTRA